MAPLQSVVVGADCRIWRPGPYQIAAELDPSVAQSGTGSVQQPADIDADAEFLGDLAPQCSGRCFTGFDLAAREFPATSARPVGGSTAGKHLVRTDEYGRDHTDDAGGI